jgi:alcohol dehydrogenase
MMEYTKADKLLSNFKGNAYMHGMGVLNGVGIATRELGSRALLIIDPFPGSEKFVEEICKSVIAAGVELVSEIPGAAPNCPREDLYRISQALIDQQPDVVVSFGGGSTIDSVKAAEVLRTLGGDIDSYFGTGLVGQELEKLDKMLSPHVAIQTASSSAAHLTKYSNITDVSSGQKKLIVDPAIIPIQPVFDYRTTINAPMGLTIDGALDGISHSLEVLYSAVEKQEYDLAKSIAVECIRLVVNHLPRILEDPGNVDSRHALGLATDLGGYAIMVGGTNGAHLTSFSLVDILSHGRACGMMNPYYTVFFAPSIQDPLKAVGQIFQEAGYSQAPLEELSGRELGLAVAEAMISFEEAIGFPTRLEQIQGFTQKHIDRALTAAKNPQLKMKLENMPVPMNAEMVDEYMAPILEAAKTGDLSLIKNVA